MSNKEFAALRQGSRTLVVVSTTDSVDNTSDTDDFTDGQGNPIILKSIYVGVTGHVGLLLEGDTAETMRYNVPVGSHNFGRIKRITTNTTAGEIVGQYDAEVS